MTRARLLLMASVTLIALTLSGCGDDDSASTSGDRDATTSPDTDESTGSAGDEADLTDQGSAPELSVEVVDSEFVPATIETAPGAKLTVSLDNTGSLEHTFTIDDADIDETLEPGASTEVVIEVPASDEVAFYCRFHGNSGMRGTITVAGSSGSGGGAGPATEPPDSKSESDPGGYGY